MSDKVGTIAEFVQVVRRSGLVPEDRLQATLAPWTDQSLPLPDELVQALIDGGLITAWQADQLRKGRHKGFVLGKYRLLRLLGTGGMSSVYLAEHATLHSLAAIKVLPVKRVDQTSYLARFEREARQSARLNHPNIVRTFDLDTAGSIHYIAMEYVEGVDLHVRVKQNGPLDIRDAAEYVRQAALGLEHAHEEGLVHRDIKPANLMLDKRGVVKILDLGLALAGGDDDHSLTREHDEKVLGTADYLAPEQAADSHKADRRSDIYALGCTLHYLLVGKAPFAKGTLAERIQAHMKQPAPNILDSRPDVPPVLADLYFRMMEKHPDARPQSAREVADTLSGWLTGQTAAAPAAARPRLQPPRRGGVRPGAGRSATTAALGGDSGIEGEGSDGGSRGTNTYAIGRSDPLESQPVTAGGSGAFAVGNESHAGWPVIDTSVGSGRRAVRSAASSTAAQGSIVARQSIVKKRSALPAWKRKEMAGLPFWFWIVAAVLLLLALVLALWVVFGRARSDGLSHAPPAVRRLAGDNRQPRGPEIVQLPAARSESADRAVRS